MSTSLSRSAAWSALQRHHERIAGVHLRDLASVGLIDATWLARFDELLRSRLQHILETPDE